MVASFYFCNGQEDTIKTKKFNHYIGVQANELIKQILNKNNSVTNNPYLLTYSINLAKHGWGAQAGFGYNYFKTDDINSAATHTSKINDFFYRAGIGQKFQIGKYILPGYGLDFIGAYQVDKTVSLSVTDFNTSVDSSESTVTSKKTSLGGGIQLSLGFIVTRGFIIGTEATGYYSKIKEKENIIVKQSTTNSITEVTTTESTNTNTETGSSKFVLSVPVAIFMIVKF